MMDSAPTARPPRRYRPPDDPRLPRFSSYAEEAAFWESHDFETLEPIPPEERAQRRAIEQKWRAERERRPGLTAQLTVRLDRETYDRIAAEARALGIGPATLARTWLRERLRSG
jgi:hypothetical protein